jgi:antitoxin (DNA-binding transcriptional repressor) of toxin-antitoxin stability system
MASTIEMEEAGSTLPDLIEKAVIGGEQVVLCRKGKPVAVAIHPQPTPLAEPMPAVHPESLAALVGTWEGFEEIEPFIEEVYRARQNEMPRDFSFE